MDFTDLNDGTWLDCYVTVEIRDLFMVLYLHSKQSNVWCPLAWDEKVKKWKVVVRG